jgi:hypothetical protein
MGWIKRNLFFVVGGLLALGMLGGAGFFIYTGWARNSGQSAKLNEIYDKLQEIAKQQPAPGNAKINNTQIAKDQEKQELDWIAAAGKYFQSIPAIPPGVPVPSAAYAEGLRQTIALLQHEADSASVTLPPKCSFSFSTQLGELKFAPGSLELLATQLGEVKAITEIFFAARVNDLDSIQRVRVSEDDTAGLQSDYIDERPLTNDLAVFTPYMVTFRSFTPELARVISGFANSPNPFIVKSIIVQPATVGVTTEVSSEAAPNPYAPGGVMSERERRYRGHMAAPMVAPEQPPPSAPGKGGLQTVLKEQLLQIKMEVVVVKLLPKS